jgi:hypothetical protein
MYRTFRVIFLCIFPVFVCITKSGSQSFSLCLNGGYSYRIMVAPAGSYNSYSTYLDRKKSGTNLTVDFLWINDMYALGIGYNRFFNSASGKNVQLAQFDRVDVHEKIRVDYYNIQIHRIKEVSKTRFSMDFEFGLGLVKYYNDSTAYTETIAIDGKTYGLHGAISFDYKIFNFIALELKPKLFMAILSEETKDGNYFKLNPKEGLTRFDINAGIRVYF